MFDFKIDARMKLSAAQEVTFWRAAMAEEVPNTIVTWVKRKLKCIRITTKTKITNHGSCH